MAQEEKAKWQLYIARAASLGGRALRRQVVREGGIYKVFEEAGGEGAGEGEGSRGLLLPFLEARQENLGTFLPKAALALQQARSFDRVVMLLAEPLPELLALVARHQGQGLQVTAVCAGAGELYGGETPEEPAGPVEEVLGLVAERLASTSPRKRLVLPYGEKERLPLTYVGDLASAALYVLRHDREKASLLVKGASFTYGVLAQAAASALGFGGRLQFGREKIGKTKAAEGFRIMQGSSLYPLEAVLPYLARIRRQGGRLHLSACVIMRDNEQDIGRCLKSLQAADEIIVVDTGSVDNSIEIARQYTEKIYHFDWIDDFAAAKNFALAQATGDWIVFPDSDEFFTEETAAGLHRIAEDYDGPGGPRELIVRHQNVDGDLRPIGVEGAVPRLFTAGMHYVGRVHEFLRPAEGRILNLSVPRERLLMLHTGYAPERLGAKNERNERLLRQAQEEGQDVPLQHYYMSNILLSQGKYAEAKEEILTARTSGAWPINMRAECYRIWYKAARGLEDKASMEEAWQAMRQEMPQMPDSYAIEGVALWNEGKEEEAAPLLLRALELYRDFLRLNPGEIDKVGEDMPAIARELTEFYEKRGDEKTVAQIRNILTQD
ncbi:MAG: glycosyltransferase family 2 protein [Selenomonas sp.]|nr:glycosyltransferase family 2 protein [Selenomonas sp.]